MHRVLPAWQILWFFHLVPHKEVTTSGNKKCIGTKYFPAKRLIIVSLLLTFLVVIWGFDVINLISNRDIWERYLSSGNRIVLLLVCTRATIVYTQHWLTIALFIFNARAISQYIRKSQLLTDQLVISLRRHRKQWAIFLTLFILPVIIMCIRLAALFHFIFTVIHHKKIVASVYETYRLSGGMFLYGMYYFCEVLGAVISLAINLQVTSFARIMRECCVTINWRLTIIRDCVVQDNQLPESYLQREVVKIRILYESLVKVFSQHEKMFSLQNLCGVTTNCCVTFSLLASCFKPDVTKDTIFVIFLGIICHLYNIFVMTIFPIQLYEESQRTVEILQETIHKRQVQKVLSGEKNSLQSISEMDQLLLGFLQRTLTKTLAVSAGGFAYITRSFLITVGAVVLGFVLFILERVENQRSLIDAFVNRTYSP